MHDQVIRGGRVALETGWAAADIGIDGGKIAAIGSGLAGRATRIGLLRHLQLTAAALYSGCDFTPYEGREVTGKPVTVLCRGRPVIEDGALKAEPGFGAFVPRRTGEPAGIPVEDTTPWLDA